MAPDPSQDAVILDETGQPKRQVVLLHSVFENRPAVILFRYTAECGAPQRALDRALFADIDSPKLYYTLTHIEYNAVINSLRHGGLYRIKDGSPKFCVKWSHNPSAELIQSLRPSQRLNSFPGSYNLGRKDLLCHNIAVMHRRHGEAFHILPRSYSFPMGLHKWKKEILAADPDALWIYKPADQSCGRGIKVFNSRNLPDEVRKFGPKRAVIQRYVQNPMTIDGYKFDLRVYAVVLSFKPLKVYLNDEGLVRLATSKYSLSEDSLADRLAHLTNYAINKKSQAFVQNQDTSARTLKGDDEVDDADVRASKWSFSELRAYFDKEGLDFNSTLRSISDVVIKTLLACEPALRMEWARVMQQPQGSWVSRAGGAHSASCFHLFGFDVMLDDAMKAWLLEVNCRPSLSSGSPLDKRIKTKLVADTLTLAGLRPPPGYVRAQRGLKRAFRELDEPGDGLHRQEDRASLAAELAACSPMEAVGKFDAAAWDLVLTTHDEDQRSGGLTRIFPTANSAQYLPYLEESLEAIVLRKWHEAGGAALFDTPEALPPGVPRPVWVTRT